MPYVTSATDGLTEAQSYPYDTRSDALLQAIRLAEDGKESVSVTDIETGEVLTGEDLFEAIRQLAAGEVESGG